MAPFDKLQDRLHARLAKKAMQGDRAAFRGLYRRLAPLVNGYVRRRIRVDADAEDLTAQVFHRMLENLSRYDDRRGSVRTWILGIARHAVIDHVRARRPGVSTDEADIVLADATLLPDDAVLRDERIEMVRSVLSTYSPEVRELLALRFGEGLRYREIAQLVGSTEPAIKQRFSRTLRDLRAQTRRLEREGATHYAT